MDTYETMIGNTDSRADDVASPALPGDTAFCHLVRRCFAARDWNELAKIANRDAARILPHHFFACAIAGAHDGRVRHLHRQCFPLATLRSVLLGADDTLQTSIMAAMRRCQPVFVDQVNGLSPTSEDGDGEAVLSAMPKAVVIHGLADLGGARIGIFCFGRRHGPSFRNERDHLDIVTTALFVGMTTVLASDDSTCGVQRVTGRELEVVHWLRLGKTNIEIATILGISEYTVKNHVQNILLKLNASNRTQAVMRAMDLGLIK